jgi:hypothetical protein
MATARLISPVSAVRPTVVTAITVDEEPVVSRREREWARVATVEE